MIEHITSGRTQRKAEREDRDTGPMTQLIVFRLGGEEYALEIGQVKEVVPTPNVSKVPLTPPYVEGVANIRGSILAIVNLEKKFEMSDTPVTKGSYTLVIEDEDWHIGFIVQEVPNTLSVPLSQIDESPALLHEGGEDKRYIRGIAKTGGRLIILLDLTKVILKSEIQATVAGR